MNMTVNWLVYVFVDFLFRFLDLIWLILFSSFSKDSKVKEDILIHSLAGSHCCFDFVEGGGSSLVLIMYYILLFLNEIPTCFLC